MFEQELEIKNLIYQALAFQQYKYLWPWEQELREKEVRK